MPGALDRNVTLNGAVVKIGDAGINPAAIAGWPFVETKVLVPEEELRRGRDTSKSPVGNTRCPPIRRVVTLQ